MRYIVEKNDGIPGAPIPEDEPCLVIRGQDIMAPFILQHYIDNYSQFAEADDDVIADLREHLGILLEWQMNNAESVKLADR
jgi:hypothetical protein